MEKKMRKTTTNARIFKFLNNMEKHLVELENNVSWMQQKPCSKKSYRQFVWKLKRVHRALEEVYFKTLSINVELFDKGMECAIRTLRDKAYIAFERSSAILRRLHPSQ
ncbi:MAG: hypothetical protein FWF46_03750 [Oscillospiraceae bacterium]|nr:hypothetical protein [Oscillospiraceae bacterium]